MSLQLKSSEATRYLRLSRTKGPSRTEGRAAWRAEVKEQTVHGEGMGRNWSGMIVMEGNRAIVASLACEREFV
jgi:hypothetical protein